MAKLIYRAVAVCGALGCGFPRESLEAALAGRVDAIVADGGSADAGPYYLGAGDGYFEAGGVKADYLAMVLAGQRLGCPVIVGSCGMAGGDRGLALMVGVAREVFAELDVKGVRVATIGADVDPEIVLDEFRAARLGSLGAGPVLSEDAIRDSVIVGQMGIHPIITALDDGAQYILAGRTCDAALFASDMVRRGVDAGLAYHAGHVIACGALACEPSSPSDCLVAEIFDDGTALFVAPNPARRCTAHSIAAHALYEESHPQLQFYPEGTLTMERTEFFSRDGRTAGIRNSRFVQNRKPKSSSIKLEGARKVGKRKISLIQADPDDLPAVPDDIPVHGRSEVEACPIGVPAREPGLLVRTRASTRKAAILLANLIANALALCAQAHRTASAATIAYPLSRTPLAFRNDDGSFGAIILISTRDPDLLASDQTIRAAAVNMVEHEAPQALAEASYEIIKADDSKPVMLLQTIAQDAVELDRRHRLNIDLLNWSSGLRMISSLTIDAPDVYGWSVCHLLQNDALIKDRLFSIAYYSANGASWQPDGTARPRYADIGDADRDLILEEKTLSSIANAPPSGLAIGSCALPDLAHVRRNDAGPNRLTFDIIFNCGENYEAALQSNLLCKDELAKIFDLPLDRIVGSYFVDSCNAVKISIDRPNSMAPFDSRDPLGAKYQTLIETLVVPIYAATLSHKPAF